MSSQKNTGNRMLLTGSILQLFLGIIYVWSVFVNPVSEFFNGWKIESVKLTSSFMLCCFVLGILIGGKLQVKIGTSKIVLFGGLLMSIGMLLTSFIPISAPWLIYITYGIAGGFGVGMAYNAIISAAQSWFVHKRGLATGISVCMFGFSTVLFAPLIEVLVKNFGLLTTFRILAGAFFLATIILFRFINMPENIESQKKSAPILNTKQYTTSQMIKTPAFYMIMFSMMFLTSSYFILNPSFVTFAGERGLKDIAVVLVMITGVANALGRLAVPLLADKIGREKAVIAIILATAISTVTLCFVSGVFVIVAIAIIAFCYGGSSGVYPLVTADYFGIKNIGSNYGAVMVGFACSALFFPMIFALVENMTIKFLALAGLAVVGSVLIIVLMLQKKKAK